MSLNSSFLGRLIVIGGNEDKVDELIVLKRVVKEVGKKEYKVVVITTASNEPERVGKEYKEVFTILKAFHIEILNVETREQANDKIIIEKLEKVDLIFFPGGDQLRLTSIIGGSKLLNIIKRKLKDVTSIAGTSAGAAVFSDIMIYEGKSEEGLIKGKVFTTSGFGFVKNIVFDTHFMKRGRIGRLIQIVTTNPSCIGVGIGEDSGGILKGDGSIEVVGNGQVIIVDGFNISHSNIMKITTGSSIAVENIRVHSLVTGYGYNFKKRQFLVL